MHTHTALRRRCRREDLHFTFLLLFSSFLSAQLLSSAPSRCNVVAIMHMQYTTARLCRSLSLSLARSPSLALSLTLSLSPSLALASIHSRLRRFASSVLTGQSPGAPCHPPEPHFSFRQSAFSAAVAPVTWTKSPFAPITPRHRLTDACGQMSVTDICPHAPVSTALSASACRTYAASAVRTRIRAGRRATWTRGTPCGGRHARIEGATRVSSDAVVSGVLTCIPARTPCRRRLRCDADVSHLLSGPACQRAPNAV